MRAAYSSTRGPLIIDGNGRQEFVSIDAEVIDPQAILKEYRHHPRLYEWSETHGFREAPPALQKMLLAKSP